MANVRTLKTSFAGGVMSPEMFGRIDDQKFQSGAAKLRNFIALPQGPAENRAGFGFVRAAKSNTAKSRLIPFTFNTTQTMVLEMGAGYFRFHTNGSTLLAGSPAAYIASSTITASLSKTATVTMTIAAPCVVTWTGHTLANGDRVILTTTGALATGLTAGTTYYVVNQATNTFQLAATSGGAAITTTGTQSGTHTATTPALITWTGHTFSAGATVGFTTTGALLTGLSANTTYYVRNPATNVFELSATSGGSAIITTGTQSGVHTGGKVYVVGDLISSGGTNYYCIATSINNTPPNATYWYPLPSEAYEIPNPYAEADLFDIHYVQSADILTFTHPTYPPKELRRNGATNWTLTDVNFSAPINPPSSVTVTKYIPTSASVNVDTYQDIYYTVTATAADGVSQSGQATPAFVANNIYVTGAYNTITWTAVTGASRYKVYKRQGGIYGYIGQTTGLSIVDDNIAPDLGITPPIYNNDFTSAGNYPSAVSYFEQRRCFAGTTNDPQKIWMTRSGTESDMSYSIPTREDDRIEFRVAAREANTIRHVIPLTQLLLLTAAAEWRVSSVNSDVITPTSISVRPQSYVGASNVQPSIINNSLVYCAARGGHVRELGYSWQSNGFITGDLSLRAAHLFDTYELVDMCYSKAPHPIIWFVSTSGDLIGLTYIPEQQLGAWHHHDTDGVFESCTVVAESGEDVLYVVVKRTVNGNTVRYIERQASRVFENVEECFFVDSGLTYNGTNTGSTTMTVTGGTTWGPADSLTITASSATFAYPATTDVGDAIVLTGTDGTQYRFSIYATSSTTVATGRVDKVIPAALRSTATTSWSFARNSISGLSHLEGKTVSILTDGAVHPQRVVTSGSIDLERAATIVTVGLPIVADMQTLPMAAQIDAGFGQGRVKNVNKAWLRVFQSSGIFIGPNENNLVEAKQRSTEPYGTAPALKSQEILIVLTPTWADSGQVFVRQSDPLPLTLVGMTLEVSMGA